MEPNKASSYWIADDELLLDEHLSELEVEDLLGCDVDFDENEDWRATEY